MTRYLVVANKTLGGSLLRDLVTRLAEDGSTCHVAVPATAPSAEERRWLRAEHIPVRQGETPGVTIARGCLRQVLQDWAALGIAATGEVGDPDPVRSVAAAMAHGPFETIIVSTMPAGASRWVAMDLPGRLRRLYDIPVLHLEGKHAVRTLPVRA